MLADLKTSVALLRRLGFGALTSYVQLTRVLVSERVWRVSAA